MHLYRPAHRTIFPFLLAGLLSAGTAGAAAPDAFGAWKQAADGFLKQDWRVSALSGIGARARLRHEMPGPEACFENLVESLPAVELWSELPAITRARLSPSLPNTCPEARRFADQRLLHAWALSLDLPAHREELRATLDDLRTVRWVMEHHLLSGQDEAGAFGHEFGQTLGNLDQALRPFLQDKAAASAPVEGFRAALRECRLSPRQRLMKLLGKPAFEQLEQVARSRRSSQTVDRNRELDPALQGWFDYGPLPADAWEVFEATGADRSWDDFQQLSVPDLLHLTDEAQAFALLQEALASKGILEWQHAGGTAVAAARALAEGRLKASADQAQALLDHLLRGEETLSAARADAALALMARLAKEGGESSYVSSADQAFALLALGRDAEAVGILGDAIFPWQDLHRIGADQAAAITRFALRILPGQRVGTPGWETFLEIAHQAHLDREALQVLQQSRSRIDGDAEALVVEAELQAGDPAAAAELLRTRLTRPASEAFESRSAVRTQAFLQLYQLGEAQHQRQWCEQALEGLRALIHYWTVEKAHCGDGGDSWAQLPGFLASRGHLELALATARLNAWWRYVDADGYRVFLVPQAEHVAHEINAPASAMAGLLQVLELQHQPKAILEYLETEEHWPVRDLAGVATCADPSFPEASRRTLAQIVSQALDQVGRGEEAGRIRALQGQGVQPAIREALARPEVASMAERDQHLLKLLAGLSEPVNEDFTLLQLGQAIEHLTARTSISVEAWRRPASVFVFRATAQQLDGWMRNGPPVSIPPLQSLRTRIVDAAPPATYLRDALLLNVPD